MRIAIVGAAPSSVARAPYEDPDWTIWACSPASRNYVRRMDAWFELHHYHPTHEPKLPAYFEWMRNLDATLYMMEQYAEFPRSVKYPKDAVHAEFGPYCYTSTIAWMAALAIQQKPTEIGFWGVDMAAIDEYRDQRVGLQHFITIAQMMGIKVSASPRSDILVPSPEYCLRIPTHRDQKLHARKGEMQTRLNDVQGRFNALSTESERIRGVLEEYDRMEVDGFDLSKRAPEKQQRLVDITAQMHALSAEIHFVRGALDDIDYWEAIWNDADAKCVAG